MLDIKVFEEYTTYLFIVSDGETILEYRWSKQLPEGQTLQEYLQNCKREAELLAQLEIDREIPPKEIVF